MWIGGLRGGGGNGSTGIAKESIGTIFLSGRAVNVRKRPTMWIGGLRGGGGNGSTGIAKESIGTIFLSGRAVNVRKINPKVPIQEANSIAQSSTESSSSTALSPSLTPGFKPRILALVDCKAKHV
ncbi:uncharacterized protein LOC119981321 isoform X3 [Tripterygium wilfordii]|uniref:uncharacterized protein LOC119981321 isoform X3 n=1 Tax=Tripterygium wilfordii TaxID=458696 RepID=UPI0018F85A75|nr:uncharacterized protein LOC119981321 isoform X3 [Tripterygium wilfordii]